MGSDAIALPLLDWLCEQASAFDAECVGLFSQPDRPKGRGKHLQPNPVSAWALAQGIPLYRPEKPGSETLAFFRSNEVDLALVMAYGHLLKKELLELPSKGFINFHASVLPSYRGASPVESAIASGETETGISLMRIVPKMDAGGVCGVERVPIGEVDTGQSLREKLAVACVPLVARYFEALLAGKASFTEQVDSRATYCRKLVKGDGALDFSAPATTLAARINGLDPWPGCYCEHGETRLRLRRATTSSGGEGVPPGTVLSTVKRAVRIATGQGVLEIAYLQRPGRKMLPALDFLKGYVLPSGSQLIGATMSPLIIPETSL